MPIIEPQKARRQTIFSDVAHLVIVDRVPVVGVQFKVRYIQRFPKLVLTCPRLFDRAGRRLGT